MGTSASRAALALIVLAACGPAASPRFATSPPPRRAAAAAPVAADTVRLQAATYREWIGIDAAQRQASVWLGAAQPVDIVDELGPVRGVDVRGSRRAMAQLICAWTGPHLACGESAKVALHASSPQLVVALTSLLQAGAAVGATGVVRVRCYTETAPGDARLWCEGDAAHIAAGGEPAAALVARVGDERLVPRRRSPWYGDAKLSIGAAGRQPTATMQFALGRAGSEVALRFTDEDTRLMLGLDLLAGVAHGELTYRGGVSVLRVFRSFAALRDGDLALAVTPVVGVARWWRFSRGVGVVVEARAGWTFTGGDPLDDDLRGPYAVVVAGFSSR